MKSKRRTAPTTLKVYGAEISKMADCDTVIEIDTDDRPLSDVIREVEAKYLAIIMTKAGGNKAHAAALAGMARDTLYHKLQRITLRTTYRFE